MKIKRLGFYLVASLIANPLTVGLGSIYVSNIRTHKIEGMTKATEYILGNPMDTIKGLFFGGFDAVIEGAHQLYTDPKLQGIYWGAIAVYGLLSLSSFRNRKVKRKDAAKYGSHGTASWMTSRQIKKYLLKDPKGMIVGEYKGKPCTQPLESSNNQMAVVIGGSGSGKSAGYTIPNVLHICEHLGESMVITDPKGEIYDTTAPTLRQHGYNIICVNLLDMKKSDRYNPLDYVNEDTEALSLAETIIKNTSAGGRDGDFWERTERNLIAALIMYIKQARPKEEQHLASVLRMGNSIGEDPDHVKALFDNLPEDSSAKEKYSIFNHSVKETRSSILTGFGVRLELWGEKRIAELTAKSDFDIKLLGREKTALYILTPDSESTFDIITAMLVDQVFQELIKDADRSEGRRLKNPVRLILDEVANIAPINDLERRISTIRSRGIRCSLIFQSKKQFENRYGAGRAAEIMDSCDNQILLQANDNYTSSHFSKKLDTTTILIGSKSETESTKGGSSGINYSYTGRPLMTPGEIEKMDEDQLILFQKGKPPAKLKKHYWFKQKRWKDIQTTSWVTDVEERPYVPLSIFRPGADEIF